MKKIIFGLGLWMTMNGVTAQAQQYTVNMSVSVYSNVYGYACDCGNNFQVKGFLSDGTVRTLPIESLDGGACLPKYFTETFNYNNNIHLDSIQISSVEREWGGTLNGCGGTYKGYSTINLPASGCFSANYTNYVVTRELGFPFNRNVPDNSFIIPGFNSQVQLDIYPSGISIPVPGASNNFLPATDKISLTATTGYANSNYRWQYFDGTSWNDFPLALQGSASVSFSGVDLYGGSFGTNFPSNTQIRINYGCGANYSNIITLKNSMSSPHIVSVTPFPNSCYKVDDGSMKVQFDRALRSDESLTVIVENTTTGDGQISQNNVTLAADNSYTWPATLKAGNYTITLIGVFPVSVTPIYVTYTGSPTHTANTSIVSPAPLTYTANRQNDVRCYGGSDGAIGINAAGGVGNYQAGYEGPGQSVYTWVPFAGSQAALNNLPPGSYSLKMKDQNGCVPRDASNNEVVTTMAINQPAIPLQLDYSQLTNPLAYGYTDGQVTAVLKGGTPNPDGSYAIAWTDGNGAPLSGAVNTSLSGSYQTQLQNRGDGSYLLQATDANFALAAAGQQDGCILKSTFTLVQPPPLTLNIEQTQRVTCHGYATAQLLAHGQGGIEIPGSRYSYQWYSIPSGTGTPVLTGQNDSSLDHLPAGVYQVMITDKNGVTKTSQPFTIGQPDQLAVSVSTTPLSCNGDSTGIATAIGSGGTLPYAYNWSTGDMTAVISGLTEGGYFVFVVDSNGCQAQQVASVSAPGGLQIDTLVTAPTCHQGSDGSIALQVTGGAGGYTYSWSTGASATGVSATAISNLPAGAYNVHISDRNGCTAIRSFVLPDPPLLSINAGQNTTLCNDQSYIADATIADPAASYQWSSNNGFAAATALVSIKDTGAYWVTVTDSRGCFGRDSFLIGRTNRDIAADFVVSTQVFQGQQVDMVNISQPDPDSINWVIPDIPSIQLISGDHVSASLLFADTGSYTIGMKAYAGPCWKMATQKVIVLKAQPFDDPGTVGDPLVKAFTVTPNPNNGEFSVHIVLSDMVKIRLRLISVLTDAIIDDRQMSGGDQYDLPYHMSNVAKGEYFLLLETPKGNTVYKIITL